MAPCRRLGLSRLARIFIALAVVFASAPALAQSGLALPHPEPADQQAPTYLSIVDGSATIERDSQREQAVENLPLVAGDRLTTARGRVEVWLGDDGTLSIDQFTTVEFLDASLLLLVDGHVHLSTHSGSDYRIDGAGSTVTFNGGGEFSVRVLDQSGSPELRVTTVRGSAELFSRYGRTTVRTGSEAATYPDSVPSRVYVVSTASYDAFGRWIRDNERDRVNTTDSRYLAGDLSRYDAVLASHGDWDYVAPHGYVWYPRVASSWRPYSDGRWWFVGTFGWTWVGTPRWAWPTHHYGRWGRTGARWYWIPDHRWGPAWVSWAGSPDYLSWCPLGYNNRPVIAVTQVTAWSSWTTVPVHAFSRPFIVHPYALRDRDPRWSRGDIIARPHGPDRPLNARADARPITPSTRRAAPRDGVLATSGSRVTGPSRQPEPARAGELVRRPSTPSRTPSVVGSASREAPPAPPRDEPMTGRAPRAVPRGGPRPEPARDQQAEGERPLPAPQPAARSVPSRPRRAPGIPEASRPAERPRAPESEPAPPRGRTPNASVPAPPSSAPDSAPTAPSDGTPRRATPRSR